MSVRGDEMATLDDLIQDERFRRLFAVDAGPCALQLWILQIKSDGVTESHVVYGRLVPYNFSNDSWSAREEDDFETIGQIQAQVIRLNLYVESSICPDLLRRLSGGAPLAALSDELKLLFSGKLSARVGEAALPADRMIYRPAAALLNRDAYDRRTPSSPHGGAGAFSASIMRSDKEILFQVGGGYDPALAALIVRRLKEDTGLDFGSVDAPRIGDVELMVFPALDSAEHTLLDVTWTDADAVVTVQFNPVAPSHFNDFQFRLCLENNGQVLYTAISAAQRRDTDGFECAFVVGAELRAIIDTAEVEVFGLKDADARSGALCCRWRGSYIREIHFQGTMLGAVASAVKFDWLEKTAHPSMAPRVAAATTVSRGNAGFGSVVGDRKRDPWVPVNRNIGSLLSRLHPPKSEGRFFPRMSQGDGDGRLQFVEWLKALLGKYAQHQIIIFDPYFETAGLALLLLQAASDTDYIVFTSLPKPAKEGDDASSEANPPGSDRVNNLVASCEQNRRPLSRLKLRIYGLKEGRLHDRYIVILGRDGLPAAGFNLSNSFQKAAENYPLLVTPIPEDVLLAVEEYTTDLVREAQASAAEAVGASPAIELLFDSTAYSTRQRRYEPLKSLEGDLSGSSLALWTGEASLNGLSGDPLKARLAELGWLDGESLALPNAAGLRRWLQERSGDFATDSGYWNVLGELLAHSSSDDRKFREIESQADFLNFLGAFLGAAFERSEGEPEDEIAIIDPQLFHTSFKVLLRSTRRLEHLYHPTKYVALTWAEFFAIRLLWWHAPSVLLQVAEAELARTSSKPDALEWKRLSLLSQIVSEITLSVTFDIADEQRDRLLQSPNGLFRWFGFEVLVKALEEPAGLSAVLPLLAQFSKEERIQVLGSMLRRTAQRTELSETYESVTSALHDALPEKISVVDLKFLIDALRGHMGALGWSEPWLFRDVIHPLLVNERASVDDASVIWIDELAALLEPRPDHQTRLFQGPREGQTTNIAAFLFAHSSPAQQNASLKLVRAILNRQRQAIQQPLASTSDWSRWNLALITSMWVLAFSRWGEFHVGDAGRPDAGLQELSRQARELAMARPIEEWRATRTGKPDDLVAFLDEANDRLAGSM